MTDPALIAIAIAIGVLLVYEALAVLSIALLKAGITEKRLPTISGAVWRYTIDRDEDGAPIVFLLGYIFGHFIYPIDLSPGPQFFLTLATVVIVIMELKSVISKSRFISRRIHPYGGPPVVFLTAFLLAHFLFPR